MSPLVEDAMSDIAMTKFRWFGAWQDEKEEAWLRKMSLDGWHFQSIDFPGFYRFEAGEPRDYVYRLDFNTDIKGYQQYLQLFQDAGWEHLTQYGSWQYFRILALPGENPDIYTDNSSKIAKYRRVLTILLVFNPIYIVLLNRFSNSEGLFQFIVFVLVMIIEVIFIYAIIKLIQRIRHLQKIKE